MNAQSQKLVPDTIPEPRTNKQRLWNKVIEFLVAKECAWRGSEVSSAGTSFVNALTDILWTIDGHHHVLGSQGQNIPSSFSHFNGYNKPELSKHRKRLIGNLSGSTLSMLSSHLFHCLQGGYWARSGWKELKNDVEELAQCVAKYTDYLESSRKKSNLNHYLTTPVRELSENLTFQFLPLSDEKPSLLSDLQNHLEKTPLLEYVAVEDYCPGNSRAKYNFLRTLKTVGVSFPTALLSYTHGNNVGNLHFMWKVASTDDSSFTDCQKVIEAVKKEIPVYHTRAMRKAMFDVFGRVTSSLKPAAARHIYRVFTGMCTV